MDKEYVVKKIQKDQFTPFNVTEEELISFALDESGLISEDTLINETSAKTLVQSFYNKRDKFRQNTRLGHILVKDYNIAKDDLIKALAYHEENEIPLGESFVILNICTKEQIESALKKQSRMRSFIK